MGETTRVDAYLAAAQPAHDPVHGRQVVAPHRGRQPVNGRIGLRHDFVDIVEGHRHQHRAEDLFLNHRRSRLRVHQHGGWHVVPVRVDRLAAGDHFRTLLGTDPDIAGDALLLVVRNQGAQLRLRIQAGAQPEAVGVIRHAGYHLIEPAPLHVETRAGHADLSGVEEDRVRRSADGGFDIGVVENDGRRLAAEFQSDSLDRLGGCPVDEFAGDGGSGERNLVHVGVLHQGRSRGFSVSGDNVDDARRKPGLQGQFAKPQGRQRRLLRRLEHHRAAGGERRCELPGRQHQRYVPRNDGAHDANRFLDRVPETLRTRERGHDVRGLAENLAGPAADAANGPGRAHDVEVARHESEHAVVDGLDLSEFVGVLFDQVRQAPEQAFAGFRRHAAPGRILERLARGGHGRIDIGGAGLGDACDLLPR